METGNANLREKPAQSGGLSEPERIREIQLIQIELIRAFVKTCEEEGLTYYMLDGTMLGAVRHGGYIPWDDDADFGMPRPDYERFIVSAGTHLPPHFRVETYQNTPAHQNYNIRLTDDRFKVYVDCVREGRYEDVWIDIWPLDMMPVQSFSRKLRQFKLAFLRGMYQLAHFDGMISIHRTDRVWYKQMVIDICERVSIQKLFSPEKQWRALDRGLKAYDCKNAGYFLNLMGAYEFQEMLPTAVFGKGAFYAFEGMSLRGPQDHKAYLSQLYGDYMTPPPVSERYGHSARLIETERLGKDEDMLYIRGGGVILLYDRAEHLGYSGVNAAISSGKRMAA